jgi:hypothetical protein
MQQVHINGSEVQGSGLVKFNKGKATLNVEPWTLNAYNDVYDHAGRTRATIRGFIKYLLTYKQDQQKKVNPEH